MSIKSSSNNFFSPSVDQTAQDENPFEGVLNNIDLIDKIYRQISLPEVDAIPVLNKAMLTARTDYVSLVKKEALEQATSCLINMAKNPREIDQRYSALRALENCGGEAATNYLKEIAESDKNDRNLRIIAATALGKCKRKAATNCLKEIAENTKNDPFLRYAALKGYSEWGAELAISNLKEIFYPKPPPQKLQQLVFR